MLPARRRLRLGGDAAAPGRGKGSGDGEPTAPGCLAHRHPGRGRGCKKNRISSNQEVPEPAESSVAFKNLIVTCGARSFCGVKFPSLFTAGKIALTKALRMLWGERKKEKKEGKNSGKILPYTEGEPTPAFPTEAQEKAPATPKIPAPACLSSADN